MEILVPIIIFAILWVIGKVTGADEEGQPGRPPPGRAAEEIDERTRRIQEEIRRRIAERQGGGSPQPQQRQATPPPVQERKHTELASERRQQEFKDQQEQRDRAEERREREFREAHAQRTSGEGMDAVSKYKQQIEEQRKKAREAAAKAESFRKRQPAKIAKVIKKERWGGNPAEVSAIRRDIYDTLHDPLAARKAFLYYEIMGTPVALRRDGHQRPHWEI